MAQGRQDVKEKSERRSVTHKTQVCVVCVRATCGYLSKTCMFEHVCHIINRIASTGRDVQSGALGLR